MNTARLDDMVRGWFVGDFDPSVLRTSDFEVAVMRYSAGDNESRHVHKIAHEITVIVEGAVEMGGETYNRGDIVHLLPGEPTSFRAITDAITCVVKTPSVMGDKYVLDAEQP